MNKGKYAVCGVLAILFMALPLLHTPALGADNVKCNGTRMGRNMINDRCALLVDRGEKLTVESAAGKDASRRYEPLRPDKTGFGFTDAAFWIRCDLPPSESARFLELQYPLMDLADLYYLGGDGTWKVKRGGYLVPIGEHEIRHRNIVFSIGPSESGTRFYLRLESMDRMEFPLALWTPEEFYDKDHVEQLILGLYYGILLVMVFYNLLLFISIRERTYLYYVLYILIFALTMLQQNGLLREFAPWVPPHSVPVISAVAIIVTAQFVLSYLNTKERSPVIYRMLQILQLLYLLPIIIGMFRYTAGIKVFIALMLPSTVIIFVVGTVSLMRGYRPARYFMLAWSALLLGVLVYQLKIIGVLPNNLFTSYGMQAGSALEVILLSLGLGDRFNAVREKALETQIRMAESFARFVPREFLKMLSRESIVDVSLGDQVQRDMTVLFSDIRSFTAISERQSPQETIDFLNAFFGRIGPVIRAHGGFIDKYIGDAVMALFPGEPDAAISASFAMHVELEAFNRERKASGRPAITIGIGIHTGTLMLGTVGEADRLETTVIADAVNVASRIEGLNKEFGTCILASKNTVERLSNPDLCGLRDLGLVRIRGKEEPVWCYEIRRHSTNEREPLHASKNPDSI